MSFQNNKKFLYLLSLFNKKTTPQLETTLLNIQRDIIKPTEQYSRVNVLEHQFGHLIKKYNKLNTKSFIPPTFTPEKKQIINNNITILKQTGISKYFENQQTTNPIEAIHVVEATKPIEPVVVPIIHIQPVAEPEPISKPQWRHDILNILAQKYLILDFDNSITDVYSVGLLGALSDEFYTMPHNDQKQFLKKIKLDAITIFNMENLYKDGVYNSKDFKKADIDNAFGSNLPVPLLMTKIYASIFQLNIIYIKLINPTMEIRYINTFNPDRVTIIYLEDDNITYVVKKHLGYIRGFDIKQYFNIMPKCSLQTLDKLKLEELQNISNSLGICIKKQGKVSKVNIKKEELIALILEKHN